MRRWQPAILSTRGHSSRAICFSRCAESTSMGTALERGACSAVVAKSKVLELPETARQHTLLIVDEPLIALQTLAAAVRRHWGKRVIGITGSAGKTTTKEAVATVLAAQFQVLKSQGNLNNGF